MDIDASKWFVGECEVDRGESGFDGCIWAAPTEEDLAEEAAGGLPAEPFCIAAQVPGKETAEFIVRACKAHVDLLKALELYDAWQTMPAGSGWLDSAKAFVHATFIKAKDAALAKARGTK